MRNQKFLDHPDRQIIRDEVHARPVEFVSRPSRVRRVALLLGPSPDALSQAHARFAQWCAQAGIAPPAPGGRQHTFDVAERRVTWELHTEFVTLTWTAAPDDAENWPAGIGLEAFETERLVSCTRIDLIDDTTVPERILVGFRPASLCISRIADGNGEVATDFVTDDDGFTRFEFACGTCTPLQSAVAVRRLLEIETYRTLVLLGLPLARAVTPELNTAESSLGILVSGLGGAGTTEQAQAALAALHALSVTAGELGERTSYRFAASRAYGEVLSARLSGLLEQPGAAGSTLTRYLRNRVDPALATCLAVEKRQAALAQKLERATELLNTRISLDIQIQNRAVLHTIAETARSQFHLQKTVEGLSTIAISYYLLGILSYVLTALSEAAHLPKNLIIAGAAPLVLLGVWLLVRSIRGSVRSK